ncbi:sigma-70 family RNA polymerase sigma factor [Fusobacterium necrophorum]|uniref:sigma-70 family RNA polymerase sigma factor n=1 Tax=Fusobacterium necrophorum TaxID=859 RepID=UPI00254FBAAF|nr:sigma-70 family RNA polymerase sigma factor [Fusobacterium necrophorum]MDK4484759.1 sigma-70 family RNA polymerase sigma factor [Fusobacterium necrophorum]
METREILELIKKAKEGNQEALEEIIQKYQKMVENINRCWGDTEDGIQEGIMGLLKALELYDIEKNVKFSTFAYYWILQRIRRYREKEYYRTSCKQIMKIQRGQAKKVREIEAKEYFQAMQEKAENTELKVYTEQLIQKVCTERERKILYAVYVQGYTYAEIGKEMGLTQQRITAILKRILQKIRREIYANNYHDRRKG